MGLALTITEGLLTQYRLANVIFHSELSIKSSKLVFPQILLLGHSIKFPKLKVGSEVFMPSPTVTEMVCALYTTHIHIRNTLTRSPTVTSPSEPHHHLQPPRQ